MRDIKLIALDMDGTLLNHQQEISTKTKQVLQQAMQEDVYVVLATGRHISTCQPYAEELQLNSYLITTNGAEIYNNQYNLVEQHKIESTNVELLWEIAEKRQIHTWMVASEEVFQGNRPAGFQDYTWLKMGFSNLEKEQKAEVIQQISQFGSFEITNSHPRNIEVNQLGVHKAKAIQSLCKKKGIQMNQVLSIGDSLNDYQMIKQAGIGVAMANAQDTILQLADAVTESNEKDGVAEAIERFLWNK